MSKYLGRARSEPLENRKHAYIFAWDVHLDVRIGAKTVGGMASATTKAMVASSQDTCRPRLPRLAAILSMNATTANTAPAIAT